MKPSHLAILAISIMSLGQKAVAATPIGTNILPENHVLHDMKSCDIDGDKIEEQFVISQDASIRDIETHGNGDWEDKSPWTLRVLDTQSQELARTDGFFSSKFSSNEGRIFSHLNCNSGSLFVFFDQVDYGGARIPGDESYQFRIENAQVKLIGFESSWTENDADYDFISFITSINFLSQKMLLKTEFEGDKKGYEQWIDLKMAPEVLGESNYSTSLQDFNYEDFDNWVSRVEDLFGEAH